MGVHLVNVFLHGINAALVFLVIPLLLLMREDGAGVSSLLRYLAPLAGALGVRSALTHRGRLYPVVVVSMLVVLTVDNSVWAAGRSRIWKDDTTLWTSAAKGSDKNHVAIHSLGYLAMKAGRVDEAISILERSKGSTTCPVSLTVPFLY